MNELYFAPGACSFVPHVGLELIRERAGSEFAARMIKLHKGEQNSPEFLALNPDGQVPVLVSGGEPITQILAICQFLDATHPEAELLPQDPLDRARAFSLFAWMNNTAHSSFTRIFRTDKFADSDAAQAEVLAKAKSTFLTQLQRIDAMAPVAGYLFGEQPSFCDAYAFTLLRWSGYAGINPASLPRYKSYIERFMKQPAVAKVLANERIGLDTFKD